MKMDMQRRILTTICQMYYEQNLTQQQIANKTGLTRMKISRSLQKAKDMGIVRIIIDYSGLYLELESEINSKYQLKETIIVDSSMNNDMKNQVASTAAYYLENNLTKNSTIAIGWGSTMSRVSNFIQDMSNMKLLFSPIIGGHGKSELDMHATTISSNLAKKTGCNSLSLLAPALVKSKKEKELLMDDTHIKEVINQTKRADYALFSLGSPLVKDSSLSKSGYLSDDDLKQLKDEGAVCDIVSIAFLNKDGNICCKNITDRSVGISESDLKNIPLKICIVEGEEKHDAVKVALKAGYINVLITDKDTAKFLVQ